MSLHQKSELLFSQ